MAGSIATRESTPLGGRTPAGLSYVKRGGSKLLVELFTIASLPRDFRPSAVMY